MGPVTRARGRAAKEGPESGKESPKKRQASPKKAPKTAGPPRSNKTQPRIDEALNTGRTATQHGRKAVKTGDNQRENEEVKVVQRQVFTIVDEGPTSSAASTPRSTAGPSHSVGSSSCGSSVASSPSPRRGVGVAGRNRNAGRDVNEEELELDEIFLRDFDLNGTYGACRGITRQERYERALHYQLTPPPSPRIVEILKKYSQIPGYDSQTQTCIWDQKEALMGS